MGWLDRDGPSESTPLYVRTGRSTILEIKSRRIPENVSVFLSFIRRSENAKILWVQLANEAKDWRKSQPVPKKVNQVDIQM